MPFNNEHVINKAYLDEKLLKKKRSVINIRKRLQGFKLQYNKQYVEENSNQRAVDTTIQMFYDKS